MEGYLTGGFVSISTIFFFGSHIHRFLLPLLLFAFRFSNGKSSEGRSQAHLRALKVQAA